MAEKIVLLIEDNPDEAHLARLAFDQIDLKYRLVVVYDGIEALDYLFGTGAYAGRDIDEMPVVVLLDLKLPKMHGHEVLERIRSDERTRLLPVVILTSSVQDEDVIRSANLKANRHVRKPVEFAEFVELVRQLSSDWLESR